MVDPSRQFGEDLETRDVEYERFSVDTVWSVTDHQDRPVSLDGTGDWSRLEGWQLFSGTLVYRGEIEVPVADGVVLDLGHVGDIAEVLLDGTSVGVRMWAPYHVSLGTVAPGRHTVEVCVTNSMANAYEGMQMPSGLMGPVAIVARRTS